MSDSVSKWYEMQEDKEHWRRQTMLQELEENKLTLYGRFVLFMVNLFRRPKQRGITIIKK